MVWNVGNQYQQRAEFLKALGYESYRHYLSRPLWASIRKAVIGRDKKCRLCGAEPYTAHHITYNSQVLAGSDLSQLIAVCRGCHHSIEFDGELKLTRPDEIAAKARKRSIRFQGGKATKKARATLKLKCRCCSAPKKKLGRDNICLDCYQKHGAAVHDIALSLG